MKRTCSSVLTGCLLAAVLLLASACQKPPASIPPAVDLLHVFSTLEALPGWEVSVPVAVFNEDNLYNLVDGQAQSFFAYGFEQVGVQRYQKGETQLNIEIWQLATPADAYGLFSAGRGGQTVELGNVGSSRSGWRLAFWQNRYFASLSSSREISDAVLWTYGQMIAAALPHGGETPSIIASLPAEGRVEGSQLFFHEAISVQMEIWLGDENPLGLSQETNGALARYEAGSKTLRLMILEYPSKKETQKGLQVLQSGAVENVMAAAMVGNRLAAVFGNGSQGTIWAEKLIELALR